MNTKSYAGCYVSHYNCTEWLLEVICATYALIQIHKQGKVRQSPHGYYGSITAYSARLTYARSSPVSMVIEPSESLHTSLAARALSDVGGRPQSLLLFVSVTHFYTDYYSLADPGGWKTACQALSADQKR